MSETNGATQRRDDEVTIEDWIVVTSTSGQQYLGRLSGARGGVIVRISDSVADAVAKGTVLTFDVAYEFATPTTQTPRGDITRNAFVMSVGMTAYHVRVHVKPAVAYCCADMHPEDRARYVDLVRRGFELLAKSRAARSNLQLPGLGIKV